MKVNKTPVAVKATKNNSIVTTNLQSILRTRSSIEKIKSSKNNNFEKQSLELVS